ncbi:exosortase A [Thiobacillus sedimenti]|uniref:Exosortase A n=1 Tax=Thiobacillus sedimenti TaxID=3110231 RepID=A0ABZ1CK85_9PROT|nr:exosortase A [Thiobacillus sp. SCUT-2]WRS39619.1 exosortase A [Thiobacillus sp. SCUT-2]
MSALPDTLPAAAPRGTWPLYGGVTALVLLALAAIFWPTFHAMAAIWERSETFAHGYLIFPISLWLIWRKREALARVRPRPDLRGLVLLAGAGAAWLLADAGSVAVVAQYAFVAMLVAAVWILLGEAFLRAAFFPLMFLFFAVPMGEFLIHPLMNVTADFTVSMLRATGIPVYREGTFFSIPSGNWSVVEGCSGLRYLIASVTLGVLYAYLSYRSFKRRLLFSLAAMVVPVFANSGRAYLIVMIAHLSDMKLALGVDHYIYGWVFFGIVMLLLFWVGSFWREDDLPMPAQPSPQRNAAPERGTGRPLLPVALAALVLAGLWPVYAHWLETRPLPNLPALAVQPAGGWRPAPPFTTWVPHWIGADRQLRQTFAEGRQAVMLELDYYVTQRQDAELINSQNFMIRQKDPAWANVGEGLVTVRIGGRTRQVRQAKMLGSDGQRILVWQWNLIDRNTVVNDYYAKLVLALDRVRLARDDGLSVLIATPYPETGIQGAAATLARFAADMEPEIARALDRVDGP